MRQRPFGVLIRVTVGNSAKGYITPVNAIVLHSPSLTISLRFARQVLGLNTPGDAPLAMNRVYIEKFDLKSGKMVERLVHIDDARRIYRTALTKGYTRISQ